MSTSSEDVLLVMNHVRHKKNDGSLYIMATRVAWMPEGKEVLAISHSYSDIKLQKISSEGKAKVQLQVVLSDNDSTTFRFVNPGGQQAQIADRNQVKGWLMQLLPLFKKKICNELEEKQRFLQEDLKLFELYTNLVVGKIISAEKFWQTYMPKKEECQSIGVIGSFLVDVKPEASDGGAGFKYNLTTDTIDNIFRTYPVVESKYVDYVPHRMSESEFWTAFFQSHYFHRDRITIGSKDLFAECSKQDESEMRKAANGELFNSMFDLRLHVDAGFSDLSSSSVSLDTSKLTPNQALIRRFNHHSLMVVKSTKAEERKDEKEVKLREKIEYSDLDNSHNSRVELNLERPDKYQSGPMVAIAQQHPMDEIESLMTHLSTYVVRWKSKQSGLLPSTTALTALGDLSPNGALMKNLISRKDKLKNAIPNAIQKELIHVQMELNELLRHFWQCFPVTTSDLERKLEYSKASIENFRVRRYIPFFESLSKNFQNDELAVHMRGMIESALQKFEVWKKRKLSSSTPLTDGINFDSMEL